jgi:hypothetical protein
MKGIRCEIQHPDFAGEPAGERGVEEAIKLVQAHPWADELARFEDKQDACPPSVYLEVGNARLHIMVEDSSGFCVTEFVPARKKLLFLSFNSVSEHTRKNLSIDSVVSNIRDFFAPRGESHAS